MALEVEYMMEYPHAGLPVTDLHQYLTEGHFWPSICLFVCEQDNSKTDRWLLMKFSGYVQNGKREILLNFGTDPDHCLDLLDP